MIKSIAINLIINMIRKFPNDAELGKELRKHMKNTYNIS